MINGKLLKLGHIHFSSVISQLLNLCINEGEYTEPLKVARVVSIYKKGCKDAISNYRPILNNLNKIFESVLYYRFCSWKGSICFPLISMVFEEAWAVSTETACMRLITFVFPAFAERKFAAVLFLDFTKAFDTVQHNILLN